MLPSGLKKQLPESDQERFVLNRGFEKNLTLYPESEWQKISREINSLNMYTKKNREFARYFFRGASEITADSTARILLPKPLMDYAGLDKEIVLFAYGNQIEIWSKELYESTLDVEPDDFAILAEDVMGRINNNAGIPAAGQT